MLSKDTVLKFLLALVATTGAAIAGWLSDKGFLAGDQVANATVEIQNAINGLMAVVAGLIVLVIGIVIHKFSGRKPEGGDKTGGSGGNLPSFLITAAALSMAGFALPSCTVIGSAVTGAAPPATAVQRAGHADATPVLVASADLAQAEAAAEASAKAGQTPPVHGLYDAGRAAEAVREVFTRSSK